MGCIDCLLIIYLLLKQSTWDVLLMSVCYWPITLIRDCMALTVSVCPDGYFGHHCEEKCQCQHGNCDPVTGQCQCHLGWMGDKCSESCPPGRFGPNCSHSCMCKNGATCDPASGCCTCSDGFYGQICELGKTFIGLLWTNLNL